MKDGLFRERAVNQRSTKLEGNVIIAYPLRSYVLTGFLLTFILILVAFLASSSFSRKETVEGFLHPQSGTSKINAPQAGIVSAVLASDGDTILQGEPILKLTFPEYLSGGDNLIQLMQNNFHSQLESLESRRENFVNQADIRKESLERRASSLDKQLEDASEQLLLAQERLDINRRRLTDLESLSRQGVIALEDIRTQQELVLNIQQQLSDLRLNIRSYELQRDQVLTELERLPGELQEQLTALTFEVNRIEQQQLELELRGEMLITAPVSGVITNLNSEIGYYAQANTLLATIVPVDENLKAVLLIPSRAYGFIKEGQVTRMRFDAFPYQHFGVFEGHVSKTSKSIILPHEMELPVAIPGPVYRVEVALDMQEVHAYGDSIPLQSGMLLTADVVLERRTLLNWLFEPLLSIAGKI